MGGNIRAVLERVVREVTSEANQVKHGKGILQRPRDQQCGLTVC